MGAKLEAIAKGKLKKEVFISEMKNYTKEIVAEIKSSDKKYKHDNISTKSCPDCGKPMLEVNGKKVKCLYAKIANVVTVKMYPALQTHAVLSVKETRTSW